MNFKELFEIWIISFLDRLKSNLTEEISVEFVGGQKSFKWSQNGIGFETLKKHSALELYEIFEMFNIF